MTMQIAKSRFAETGQIIRQERGHRIADGTFQAGPEQEPEEVSLVSAPPSAAVMRDIVPEGGRLSESRMFWIDTDDLKPMRVGFNATDGDRIEYEGKRYRIKHVEDWTREGFVEVLAVREDGQSD